MIEVVKVGLPRKFKRCGVPHLMGGYVLSPWEDGERWWTHLDGRSVELAAETVGRVGSAWAPGDWERGESGGCGPAASPRQAQFAADRQLAYVAAVSCPWYVSPSAERGAARWRPH